MKSDKGLSYLTSRTRIPIMKLIVIIPAYNEEHSVETVINQIPKDIPGIAALEIVVIDDGSSDETTKAAAKTKKATVITLPYNLGIGGAVQTGFIYAQRKNYDVVLRIDGDGQHRPEDIPKLLEPIMAQEADTVIGSRFLKGQGSYPVSSRWLGQRLIALLTSLIIRQKITDSTSGFRCYNKQSIALLNEYYPADYPEPEEIIFLRKNKFRIQEVRIKMQERQEGSSSLTTINSFYYLIKVILALFISMLRAPVI